MRLSPLAFALLSVSCTTLAASPTKPFADRIYVGGDIITVNDSDLTAEALAIKNGRILAVGKESELMKLRDDKTKIFDLDEKTMIPGFIDGHGHVFNTGIQALSANLLADPDGNVNSIASLQEELRSWVAKPENGKHGIILGFGYDDSQLKEQRHPTRQELDEVSKDLPVLIIHQSGHLATLNTKALELAGLTSESTDPDGGKIRRESDGKTPNGVLEETAFFGTLLPLFAKLNAKENEVIFKAGMELYASFGYTTAQEGRASTSAVKTMYNLAQEEKLPIDVAAYPDIQVAQEVISPPYYSSEYSNGFRVAGAKLNLDGSPQGKTAWLTEPYLVPPVGQEKGYKGYPSMSDKKAAEYIELAHRNGWQLLTHVNGDAAIDQLLNGIETSEKIHGIPDRGFIAIHAQTARKDQVESFKRLGVFPSFFPMHTFYWGDWHMNSVLGKERAENISPTGWARDLGMIYTSHHDSPVALPNSMRVYSATVNRVSRTGHVLGPQQRVSALDGLKSQTLWAATQYKEEKNKGSLEVGKLADLVILSDNPLTAKPATLSDIRVLETIKEGQTIYSSDQQVALGSCINTKRCQEIATTAMISAGLLHHSH
ncbi:amidohydrolase [Vibrio parahaemolyticus]|uniref:amidohydrolase n=1 Tax=Vibrio parahaemolyticus TaxID=670 RepID=UPI00084A7BD1|nr:amidohydrolase [Vibrio parahaemolyticus]EGR3353096.1 amidohydrolase [Vibrio parahaemolyticus]EJG1850817.1 amidohydrolase [Vibrio parahaemolyticus]ODZ77132.1 amidohydrolase [Vibrio parahaemolyticus]OEA17885.1 amidohydrolase [Vibrio parahaemolyticus]